MFRAGSFFDLAATLLLACMIWGCTEDCPTRECPAAEGDSPIMLQPDGSGDFSMIQAALDSAEVGSTIELADGVYKGAGNRDLDFRGKTLTLRSSSGDPSCCIIDCEGDSTAHHRGFCFRSGESSACLVEGIGVTGGYAGGESIEWPDWGGAVSCTDESSPTFRNCVFARNYCTYVGGAIATSGSSHPAFIDCEFVGNRCGMWGGAAYCDAGAPEFLSCVFSENTALEAGGILCDIFSAVSIRYCVFLHNQARLGAAISCCRSAPLIDHCTLCGNSGETGAIYTYIGGSAQLLNTIIAYSDSAAAIHCDHDDPIYLSRCNLFGNEGGDWTEPFLDQQERPGNLSCDPCFCDRESGNLRLRIESPCSPDSTESGGLVGALPVGCW
ncbi:MAG: hypothetical protein GF330_12475 [Candidatus Eisenbacteria bacterium]|nr:hypothetical protein [Candidatus Eisenbacteria bacterium]